MAGTYNLPGNAAYDSVFIGGDGDTSVAPGTLNQSAFTLSTGANFYIGNGGAGTYNLSNTGIVNTGTVEIGHGSMGVVNVSGSAQFNAGGDIYLGSSGPGVGVFNQSGFASSVNLGTHGIYFGRFTTSGTYNLDGGTLSAGFIGASPNSPGATRVFNFNGGTLRATGNNANFFGGLTVANVRGGGATIDTNGFDVTVSQGLVHSTIFGDPGLDGGFLKDGAGTLTLTGASNFNGGMRIFGGTVALAGSGSLSTMNVSVISGTNFTIGGTASATLGGSLALGNNTTTAATGSITGGTLTATGTYVGGAGLATFAQSGGAHNVTGLYLGYNATGNGSYTLSGGSVSADNIYVGYDGTGTFTQTGGTATVNAGAGHVLYLGYDAGSTGTYTLSGTGVLNTQNTAVGLLGNGTFNLQTGGTHNVTGNLSLGGAGTSLGTYNETGGTLTTSYTYVGAANNGNPTGVFNQSGGTHTVTNQLVVGSNTGALGSYNLSAGSLGTGSSLVGTFGSGVFNQTGGTHTTAYLGVGFISGSSTGVYNLSGAGVLNTTDTTVGASGNGTFNQDGGTHTVSDILSVGAGNSATGTYNLNGGALAAGSVKGILGTRTFNFNGGILRALASDNPGDPDSPTTFFSGFTTANVRNGGAVIDTQGFNVTVNQTLLHSGIAGDAATDGGLLKTGSGTLTLAGAEANTFNGVTRVQGGTLVLAKSVSQGNPQTAIAGDLVIGNTGAVAAAGAAPVATVRLLADAQTPSDPAIPNQSNVTVYADGLFDLNGYEAVIKNLTMTGGEVALGSTVTGDPLGDLTPALLLTGNITVNASAAGSRVTAGDASGLVILTAPVLTATVARGTAVYDLDVSAGIVSLLQSSTLVKDGAGVMRLGGASTGPPGTSLAVTVNAGTLAVANSGALGAGDLTLAGGTLVADGGDRMIYNTVNVTGNATLGSSLDGTPRNLTLTGDATLGANATLTVSNNAVTAFTGVIAGAGALNVNAPGGTVRLVGSLGNTYSGGTQINGGKLLADSFDGSATGSGPVAVNAGGTLGGNGLVGGDVTVFSGGILSPGNSAGQLYLDGSLTLAGGSTLAIEFDGTRNGVPFDQVFVGGPLTVGGNLSVTLLNDFTLTLGQSYTIIDNEGGALTLGFFANAPGGIYIDAAGDRFLVDYAANADGGLAPNDVTLTYLGAVPEPGTWGLLLAGSAVGALSVRRRGRSR